MSYILNFEKELHELEEKINNLEQSSQDIELIKQLKSTHSKLLQSTYSKLSAWDKVQIARHPNRPKSLDYIQHIFTDVFELEGDRAGGTDHALITAMARLNNKPVMILAQEKGHDLESRQKHNFGMVSPVGYRKAQRCIKLADKLGMPIISLIDTAGAYPCEEAERLGQADSIAKSMQELLRVKVPVIACVIGEGGSGGAIGVGVANTVIMLEYSIYSIAAPEAVSSILFKTADYKAQAAEALKLTAQDLKHMGYADIILPEKPGGAHRYRQETIELVGQTLTQELNRLSAIDGLVLMRNREKRYENMD